MQRKMIQSGGDSTTHNSGPKAQKSITEHVNAEKKRKKQRENNKI